MRQLCRHALDFSKLDLFSFKYTFITEYVSVLDLMP
jgi:hypothetical protein